MSVSSDVNAGCRTVYARRSIRDVEAADAVDLIRRA
jgi:hypothetical protein